jgi:Tfp pilus assembly protein PilF
LYNLNRIDAAISAAERAIEVDPATPDFHNNLGVFLKAAGQFEKAADCFREAIRLNPQYLAPYHNLLDIPGAALPAALAENLRALLDNPAWLNAMRPC